MSVSTISQLSYQRKSADQTREFANTAHETESGFTRFALGFLSVMFLLTAALFFLYTVDFLVMKLSHGSYHQLFHFFKAI